MNLKPRKHLLFQCRLALLVGEKKNSIFIRNLKSMHHSSSDHFQQWCYLVWYLVGSKGFSDNHFDSLSLRKSEKLRIGEFLTIWTLLLKDLFFQCVMFIVFLINIGTQYIFWTGLRCTLIFF